MRTSFLFLLILGGCGVSGGGGRYFPFGDGAVLPGGNDAGTGNPGSATVEEYCTAANTHAYQEACAYLSRCCNMTEKTTTLASLLQQVCFPSTFATNNCIDQIKTGVASRTIKYDAAAAARCITAIQGIHAASTCDGPNPAHGLKLPTIATVCDSVTVGSLPEGASCSNARECQGPLAVCTGGCHSRMLVAIGQGCDPSGANTVCALGSYCYQNICTQMPGESQPCPANVCSPGLVCLNGLCRNPIADGQPCPADAACVSTRCMGVCVAMCTGSGN